MSDPKTDASSREEEIAEARMELMLMKYLKGPVISPAYLHEMWVVLRLEMLEEARDRL